MRKYIIFLLAIMHSLVSFSETIDLSQYKLKRGMEVTAIHGDVFYFQGDILEDKIPKGETAILYFSGQEKNARLYSKQSLKGGVMRVLDENFFTGEVMTFRNTPVARVYKTNNLLVILLSLLILIIGLLRLWVPNVFFTYVAPMSTYSNTSEIAAKLNFRNLLLPLFLFLFCFMSAAFCFKIPSDNSMLFANIILILGVLLFKGFFVVLTSVLCQINKFKQVHMLEFLKWGIMLSILFLISQTILIFNHVESTVIYEIILFFYLVVWLVRISYIFINVTKRKFIYFFSYLCATEGVPILLLTVFWN